MAEPWKERVPPGGPWFGGTSGGGGAGEKGDDGREVELRKGETHVQWRYEGESTWRDLVALDDLKGEKGDPGEIPDVEGFLTEDDLAGYVTDSDLSSALSGKANATHTHEQSDITGLSTALSGKANTSHTHTASNISDFNSAADARITASTTIVKTTGNQTVAGVKTFSSAPVVPDGSFSIAKTSGLQAALDGKVGSGNSSVTGIEFYDSVEDLPGTGTVGVIYVVPVE